ncbi:MAG TPA: uroporphyrinogen decarboxylase family protein [Armatimonadota bacterium]
MTPREIVRAAIQFEPYDGPVPHLELEFQLSDSMFGEPTLYGHDYEALPPHARRDALVANAKLWIRVSERFGYNVITGLHWLPLEAQAESFGIIRELSGDRFMLSANQDGTQAIPNGEQMLDLSIRMADDADGLLSELDARCNRAIENCRLLIDAGAEIVFMCSDYCFNSGPFLSPRMFRRFVTPFLKRQTRAIQEAGGFAVKHTDGNLWPIMDQLLECKPDGLHSIDPMAGMDIRKVRETVGDRVCLFGNVDCSRLQSGTPEEIETSARYCLDHGPLNGTGYVFASSNCIFKGVPEEAYLGMLAVRDAWQNETHNQR